MSPDSVPGVVGEEVGVCVVAEFIPRELKFASTELNEGVQGVPLATAKMQNANIKMQKDFSALIDLVSNKTPAKIATAVVNPKSPDRDLVKRTAVNIRKGWIRWKRNLRRLENLGKLGEWVVKKRDQERGRIATSQAASQLGCPRVAKTLSATFGAQQDVSNLPCRITQE